MNVIRVLLISCLEWLNIAHGVVFHFVVLGGCEEKLATFKVQNQIYKPVCPAFVLCIYDMVMIDAHMLQGASAQGVNPLYAKDVDVLVPNIDPHTGHVIRNDDAVMKTTFKSEVSYDTAYSGVSTRKVIMEERNVYCGPYNVMVLCDR